MNKYVDIERVKNDIINCVGGDSTYISYDTNEFISKEEMNNIILIFVKKGYNVSLKQGYLNRRLFISWLDKEV